MYHCTILELFKFFPSESLGSKPEQTKPFQPVPEHLPFWGWRVINSRESHFFSDMKTEDRKGVVTFARLPLELGLNYRITQNIAVYIGRAVLSLTGHRCFIQRNSESQSHLSVLRNLLPLVPTIFISCFNLTSASPKL